MNLFVRFHYSKHLSGTQDCNVIIQWFLKSNSEFGNPVFAGAGVMMLFFKLLKKAFLSLAEKLEVVFLPFSEQF